MRKITIDDLIVELDNASKLASECQKPSAMIAATATVMLMCSQCK